MTTKPSTTTQMSDFIDPSAVAKQYDENDVHQLGKSLDAAMAALANGSFSRDEATLAYLTTVESIAHLIGWRHMKHDALIWPAIDKIISQYPDSQRCDIPSLSSLNKVKGWVRVSEDYYNVVSAVINSLKSRMKVVDLKQGWTAFYPTANLDSEKRNRWFKLRWDKKSELAGRDLLKDDVYTRSCVMSIDESVIKQIGLGDNWNGLYNYPRRDWYRKHCLALATQALEGQFEHVETNEVWRGLSKQQILLALQPLYLRAAMRYIGHIRLFKYLKEKLGAQAPVSLSAVEVIELADLVQEVASSAGISQAQAQSFLNGLVRRGKEENYSVQAYPLFPLHADRVAFLPSAVLFGNWPLTQQLVIANQVNKARDKRQTNRVLDVFSKRGFSKLAKSLELKDPATRNALTDLDIVVVSDDAKDVLVLQLKSFIVNSSLLKIQDSDVYITDAIRQCTVADSNLAVVKSKIETELKLSLDPEWKLRQVIVVEHYAGLVEPSQLYPVIAIEWLESEVRDAMKYQTLSEIWHAALNLPDAEDFLSAIGNACDLVENPLLLSGQRFAVFGYSG